MGAAPDRNSYNAVMKAYANARGGRREDAIANVERMLEVMEGRSKSHPSRASSSTGVNGGGANCSGQDQLHDVADVVREWRRGRHVRCRRGREGREAVGAHDGSVRQGRE